MKRKNLIHYILFGLLLVSLVIVVSQYRAMDRLQLKTAQAYLFRNRVGAAEKLFTQIKNSIWVKQQARLGLVITNILSGKEPGNEPNPLPHRNSIDLHDYYFRLLLGRLFLSGEFDKCIKLAKIGKHFKNGFGNLYSSAVMMEKGDFAGAWADYLVTPDRLKYTVPGRKIRSALEVWKPGTQCIVRDRGGEVIGRIGEEGRFHFLRSSYRVFVQPVFINQLLNSKIKNGLRLTIDLRLSRMAFEALGSNKGSIVLVQPGTGEILAAVSDSVTTRKMGEGSSPAFQQMLEPASISKLITIAAAARNELDVNGEIAGKRCGGGRRYNGKILWCPSALRKLRGLDHALAVSCNSMFADLGVKVGWEKMLAELRLFGFDSETSNPFSLGKIIVPGGDNRSLADLSIGLENTVTTPVHAALIASVFADDGAWINPRLLLVKDGFIGLTPRPLEHIHGVGKRSRILEKSWLPVIRDAMWAVTRYGGTAGYIGPPGLEVHMKTGTGGNYGQGFHTNYIGYAAGGEKSIAFCVRVTGKRKSYQVRRATYDVNGQLLTGLKQWLEN
ncbi:MAG: hypothetical protein GY940_37350 [bacterium]|nr:hypothetical protein [bacterium]